MYKNTRTTYSQCGMFWPVNAVTVTFIYLVSYQLRLCDMKYQMLYSVKYALIELLDCFILSDM